MADGAVFRVRTEASARIKLAMEDYVLAKDRVGGFKYNNAVTFVERIGDILKDEYFESATDGMRGLLSSTPNEITRFQANVAVTKADVKAASIVEAATRGQNATPEITTNEDAQEEATRINVFRLAVIGVKEQMAKEITAAVGEAITNPILRNADGVRFK